MKNTQANRDPMLERRGALNDLAALAWKWEERARAAERTLRGRRAREWGAFVWGLCVGGAVATFGYLAGLP